MNMFALTLAFGCVCLFGGCTEPKPDYGMSFSFKTGENHEFGAVYNNDGGLLVAVVITKKMGVGFTMCGRGFREPNGNEREFKILFDKIPNKLIDLTVSKGVDGTRIVNNNDLSARLPVGSVLIVNGQLEIVQRVNIKDYTHMDELIDAVTDSNVE